MAVACVKAKCCGSIMVYTTRLSPTLVHIYFTILPHKLKYCPLLPLIFLICCLLFPINLTPSKIFTSLYVWSSFGKGEQFSYSGFTPFFFCLSQNSLLTGRQVRTGISQWLFIVTYYHIFQLFNLPISFTSCKIIENMIKNHHLSLGVVKKN